MVKVKLMLKSFSGSDPDIWIITSHDLERVVNFLKNCQGILSSSTEKSLVFWHEPLPLS